MEYQASADISQLGMKHCATPRNTVLPHTSATVSDCMSANAKCYIWGCAHVGVEVGAIEVVGTTVEVAIGVLVTACT